MYVTYTPTRMTFYGANLNAIEHRVYTRAIAEWSDEKLTDLICGPSYLSSIETRSVIFREYMRELSENDDDKSEYRETWARIKNEKNTQQHAWAMEWSAAWHKEYNQKSRLRAKKRQAKNRILGGPLHPLTCLPVG